jgi:hypothetical protein
MEQRSAYTLRHSDKAKSSARPLAAGDRAGDLAGILALVSGNKQPVTAGRDGLQVTLVAGTRNQRDPRSIRIQV